jgi:hypothetical protein
MDELVVLVGLARLVLHADDEISPAEQDALVELQGLVGPQLWNQAVLWARARFPTEEALMAEARMVRPSARWALLAALTELAGSDGIAAPEASWLGRIVLEWKG